MRADSPARRKSGTSVKRVTRNELEAIKLELDRAIARERKKTLANPTRKPKTTTRGAALRWNPEPEDVQRSVVQLVLTLVELIRRLMERQAIRRMENGTLTTDQTDAIGTALMQLESTIRQIGKDFDLTPEDLNLDLGGIKLM